MAFAPTIRMSAAMSALDAIVDHLDDGSGPATLEIFTGSQPASCASADTGTKLATLTMSDPAFGSAADGPSGIAIATANAITSDSSADNTGTAGYFRAKDSNGVVWIQGTCGTASTDFILNTTSITAGLPVACTSFLMKLPDGSGTD